MSRPMPGLGLELGSLEAWLHEAGLGSGPVTEVEALSGGTQNLLVRFTLDGERLVLRRPPLRKRPESDTIIQREIRVLGVLRGTAVPAPRLRAACPGPDVPGSPFYVTDFVDGFNPAEGLPAAFRADPGWQAEIGFQMIDALAELSRVPAEEAIAAGFRRPDGWLERQPDRWLAQLTGYGVADLVPAGERLAGWLRGHAPRSWRPGLVHGDFHLGNVLIRPDAPLLAAVVDWELATVGDPLLDLAHLLAGWPVGNPGSAHAGLDAPWLPDRSRLLERYLSAGAEVHDLDWYGVLACFRLGVLLEGTFARALAGAAPASLGDRFHGLAASLFTQGEQLVAGGRLA